MTREVYANGKFIIPVDYPIIAAQEKEKDLKAMLATDAAKDNFRNDKVSHKTLTL